MSLRITAENERGQFVDEAIDINNHLLALVARGLSEDWKCLGFIDPYGNTTFNKLQIPQVIKELRELQAAATDRADQELIFKLLFLAEICQERVHHYFKIYGD
jgi:hypothetical protein